jgi:hypothetical protein
MRRAVQTKLLSFSLWSLLAGCSVAPTGLPPTGNAVIRAPAGDSEVVITTTGRVAGAIHSLTWGGKEFINSTDHGRQLQSASNLDAGIQPMRAETFNPTEAGSRRDHVGAKSSSRLLSMEVGTDWLGTTTQMAFWLAPDEKSGGFPARNTTVLSHHVLEKRVQIGWRGQAHVISYEVTFTVPPGESHQQAVFEALTGYMPAEFSAFWKFNRSAGDLEPLGDGPGEQLLPIVLATENGSHAMGIWSPEANARYGRFRFLREKVVKWNCVFRQGGPGQSIAAGRYPFRQFVVVGSLADVRRALVQLQQMHAAGEL